MLKLMKYEFRKQLLSKLIIAFTLVALEVLFLVGVGLEKEDLMGLAAGIFAFLTFAAMFYVSFECVLTFSNDLRTKQSYMLFLTPNTAYQIVGAKMIASVIQIFLTWVVFCLVFIGNVFIVTLRYSEIAELMDMIEYFFKNVLSYEIGIENVFLVLGAIIISWIATILLALLAITLSSTMLSNTKGKGIISILLFFALNFVVYKISDLIIPNNNSIFDKTGFTIQLIYLLIISAISYFVTARLLDKKVSL